MPVITEENKCMAVKSFAYDSPPKAELFQEI